MKKMTYIQLMERLEQIAGNLDVIERKTISEALDIINDYSAMAKHYNNMVQKYETKKPAVRRAASVYICAECHNRIYYSCNHCNKCGQRIDWDIQPRKMED